MTSQMHPDRACPVVRRAVRRRVQARVPALFVDDSAKNRESVAELANAASQAGGKRGGHAMNDPRSRRAAAKQSAREARLLSNARERVRSLRPPTPGQMATFANYVAGLEAQLEQAGRREKALVLEHERLGLWHDDLVRDWNAQVEACRSLGLDIVGDDFDAEKRRTLWSWYWKSGALSGQGRGYPESVEAFRGALTWLVTQVTTERRPGQTR